MFVQLEVGVGGELFAQLQGGLTQVSEEGLTGGRVSVQPWLGGGDTALLELRQPDTVHTGVVDAGVNMLEDTLVDLVGIVGQQVEHQPVWTVDMNLENRREIESFILELGLSFTLCLMMSHWSSH